VPYDVSPRRLRACVGGLSSLLKSRRRTVELAKMMDAETTPSPRKTSFDTSEYKGASEQRMRAGPIPANRGTFAPTDIFSDDVPFLRAFDRGKE
jgi:hypothetical protein